MITALKSSPIFSQHQELFDENIDDATRKRLMQKIRNKVSAQESRDRKKVQFSSVIEENTHLSKENHLLKQRVTQLVSQNQALRAKLKENGIQFDELNLTKSDNNSVSTEDYSSQSIESDKELEQMNRIGQLFRDDTKGDTNWKTFSIFLVGIMVCTMVLPQANNLMPLKAGGIFPQFSSKLGKPCFSPLIFRLCRQNKIS